MGISCTGSPDYRRGDGTDAPAGVVRRDVHAQRHAHLGAAGGGGTERQSWG